MKILTVSTDTLWKNFTECHLEMFRDEPDIIGEHGPAFLENLSVIARGDMEGMRELFKSGETMILMGNDFEEIDNSPEAEVRVTHNGKLIGVVIDSELLY